MTRAKPRAAETPDARGGAPASEPALGKLTPVLELGFHHEQEESVPLTQRTVQHGIYQGFVAPAALYTALAFVMFRNRQTRIAQE